MFNSKEELHDIYTTLLFIDLSKVSNTVFRAIRTGLGDLNYEISISHKKGAEILQFNQAQQDGVAIKLPAFYVKKYTNEQGKDIYAGAYKVKKSGKYVEQPFSLTYAENLYKGCKHMIDSKEIRSSRIVSR